MSIAVTCPKCRGKFELPRHPGERPIRCPLGGHFLQVPSHDSSDTGIQIGNSLQGVPVEDPDKPPHRPAPPRSPFPVQPLVIVLLGVLLLLLALSGSFNLWFLANPRGHFHGAEEARRAEELARQQAEQAKIAAQQAQFLEQQAKQREATLQQRVRELERQVEGLKMELDEAKGK